MLANLWSRIFGRDPDQDLIDLLWKVVREGSHDGSSFQLGKCSVACEDTGLIYYTIPDRSDSIYLPLLQRYIYEKNIEYRKKENVQAIKNAIKA